MAVARAKRGVVTTLAALASVIEAAQLPLLAENSARLAYPRLNGATELPLPKRREFLIKCARLSGLTFRPIAKKLVMTYRVTYRNKPVPFGPSINLRAALQEAHLQISAGEIDVTVQDDIGNSIRGEDLAACCRGEKRLTIDLKVESKGAPSDGRSSATLSGNKALK